MKLIWNGHSCFTVDSAEGTVVLDPYGPGAVPGLGTLHLQADLVLCSHGHADHGAADRVTLSGRPCGVRVEEIRTWHDDAQGALRGTDTIYILRAEGLKVVHLGDLGCALTPGQIAALEAPDALMIPVGGHFTIDAAQAQAVTEQLHPRVVLPMHYRSAAFGYPVIATLDPFLALRHDVVRYDGNVLELTADTPAQTAVLTCPEVP